MAEYRLAPAAERDLEAIWAYTVQQWGVEHANRYTDLLIAAFVDLAQQPKTAATCDHIRPDYRRRNVARHTIYFRLMPYGIAVIRILHDRMDVPRYL